MNSETGGLNRFMELAAIFTPDARLLATRPDRVIFKNWDGLESGQIERLQSVILYDDKNELRWEKPFGADTGFLRLITENAEGGEYMRRYSTYLLRKDCGGGYIGYMEYFQPDEYGFLQCAFARLAEVKK